MANFIHYPMATVLIVVLLSVLYVNSAPINETIALLPPGVEKLEPFRGRGGYAETDCSGHGHYPPNGISCQCDWGWATVNNATGLGEPCSYRQRSKKTAFFLSFFLGSMGVDWFYLSRSTVIYIAVGVLKLLLAFGCWGSWPAMYFGSETETFEMIKSKLRGVSTCFTLLAFTWWIVDWARILGNRFLDGNQVALAPW